MGDVFRTTRFFTYLRQLSLPLAWLLPGSAAAPPCRPRMTIVLGRTLIYASLALIAGTGTRALAEHISSRAFIVSLNSGSLAGTTFPVFFSYDADQVSAQGDSFIALTSIDFTLGSVS